MVEFIGWITIIWFCYNLIKGLLAVPAANKA